MLYLVASQVGVNVMYSVFCPTSSWYATTSSRTGALTAVVVCPLDVLKTRLQVQKSSTNKYTGIGGTLGSQYSCPVVHLLEGGMLVYNCDVAVPVCVYAHTGGLTRIVRDEGFRGLYRGLAPSLFALLPNWAVCVVI